MDCSLEGSKMNEPQKAQPNKSAKKDSYRLTRRMFLKLNLIPPVSRKTIGTTRRTRESNNSIEIRLSAGMASS